MGEIFIKIMQVSSQEKLAGPEHYQFAFRPLLYGVALAALLTFALKETGWAARPSKETLVTA